MYEELFQKTRLNLVRRDLKFFGFQCLRFNWNVYNFDEKIVGYVIIEDDDKKSLVKSYGTININKKHIKNMNTKKLTFILLHELLHILGDHCRRRGNRDSILWNIACDHVVDNTIKMLDYNNRYVEPYGEDGYHVLNGVLPSDLWEETPEKIYDYLNKNKKVIKNITKYTTGDGKQIAEIEFTDGTKITVQILEENNQKQQQKVKNIINAARAEAELQKERGLLPANIYELIEKLIHVHIPWEEILSVAIKTNTILKPSGRSWRNLNIYYRNLGITSPGIAYEEEKENVGILIVTLDSSGSISKKELSKFANVVGQSMKYFRVIIVIVHDVTIHNEVEFDSDDIAGFEKFVKEGIKGRGGTSHKDVFKRIKEIYEENVDELSCIISLTDGESDIDTALKPNLGWPNVIPLIFVLTRHNTVNVGMDFEENKLKIIPMN